MRTALATTLSTDAAARTAASDYVKAQMATPGQVQLLLALASDAAQPLDEVRLAAATNLQLLVRRRYVDESLLAKDDADALKASLVRALVSTPSRVAAQMQEAISLIASIEFPYAWPELLPELVAQLGLADAELSGTQRSVAALRCLHAVLKKYRVAFGTDDVLAEIAHILPLVQQPLFTLGQELGAAATRVAADEQRTPALYEALLALCKVFYDLCAIDLPAHFDTNLDAWLELWRLPLAAPSSLPSLQRGSAATNEPGLLFAVQGAVCEVLRLFIEKYEEDFAPHVGPFVATVWQLLMNTANPPRPEHDALASSAIAFLTATVKSSQYALFDEQANPGALQHVCRGVIVPAMYARDDDEELFDFNGLEYLRRDVEGSDTGTRRRAACELVKGMRKHFNTQVTGFLAADIETMLSEYAAAPKADGAWRKKDAAMFLVTALAVVGSTSASGATQLNPLVPIGDIFNSQVLPELQAAGSEGAQPILTADALKFTFTFRSVLPREAFEQLLPFFFAALRSPNYVVHTYAAMAISLFVQVREAPPTRQLRYAPADVAKHLQPALEALFGALSTHADESRDNPYIMQAIKTLVVCAGVHVLPVAGQLLEFASRIIQQVCTQSTDPAFTHYTFEMMAALVCIASDHAGTAEKADELVGAVEQQIMPLFVPILNGTVDMPELHPPILQMIALCIERRPRTLSAATAELFPSLLHPDMWSRRASVPALTRLLCAYYASPAAEARKLLSSHAEYLGGTLGVFQKLLASSQTDTDAFELLETLTQHVDAATLDSHMPQVYHLIFHRLTVAKTSKFVLSFLVWFALAVALRGAAAVLAQVNGVKAGLWLNVVRLFASNINKVYGDIERRLSMVAAAALLTDAAELQKAEHAEMWQQVLVALLQLCDANADGTEVDGSVDARSASVLTKAAGAGSAANAGDQAALLAHAAHAHMQEEGAAAADGGYARLVCAVRRNVDPLAGKVDNAVAASLTKVLSSPLAAQASKLQPALLAKAKELGIK